MSEECANTPVVSDDLAQRVLQLISETQEIPIEKISRLDAPFDEIGLTSLNALSIVFEIENEFGVTIRDEDALLLNNIGDVVTRGQPLLILEAMKMEHAIAAPRDGRVSAVNCSEGELVQPGVDLIELT